ncbi:SM-20-related protein [Chitinivorax tropicus]|uniref:SM-20-related protein n=1 Tax=Chitinivorax tropicus TaxID=714531 RepID=A0A840MGX9_9PROT|nr:2OG-Fe(II) oxygenase [Chitinivorax tropicus]MBB5016785.1 SM-20-related protein [Chitinivorax tropicus]
MSFSGALLSQITDGLVDVGYVVIPDTFSAYEVAALAADCRQGWRNGLFHAAAVGRGEQERIAPDIRADHVRWLDMETATPHQLTYLDKMESLRQSLNQSLYLGLLELETHFAIYPEGAFYKRHVDNFRGTGQRQITTILYLNEQWQLGDGGELRIYLDESNADSYIDVPPRAGTMVVFHSPRFYHEVLPAKRERMSLTGWFRTR